MSAVKTDRILFVDDDPITLKVTRATLAKAGYEIATSEQPLDALKTMLRRPPDVLLLDVNMPGMPGDKLARLLRRNPITKDIRIVFYSGQTEAEMASLVTEVGALGAIEKTNDGDELLRRLEALIAD